ncbi:MAG: radical SAM protein [Desulfobaccales bacterium]
MDLITKKAQIEAVRREVGWVYRQLLWLTEEEARRANQERGELLEALSGWVTMDCQGSKPRWGPLSPGCIICGAGDWECNFINTLCTRHCFYCPQDRAQKTECEAATDGLAFKNPGDHLALIKKFQIRGVGFSGGEPLLVLDRLLAHIAAIRREWGDAVYLWLYTNGDRLDRGALEKLRDAGLGEVRFDLSARGYDLTPVRLAREYISTIAVEIPAIPEDLELLKNLLAPMEQAGVDFLNLHQLGATEYNYQAFRRRRYHFLHQPGIPIFESELCALKLLRFAREHRVNLPINYCSQAYKNSYQGRGKRTRLGRAALQGYEELTANGFIRSFQVLDAKDKLASLIRRLEGANCPPDRWQSDVRQTQVAIHSELLAHVDWSSADVALLYWEPGVRLQDREQGLTEANIVPNNIKVYQEHGWSQAAVESWRKLYLEKMNPKEVFRSFYRDYPASSKEDLARLQKEADNLKKLVTWEELASGLPEIY